MELWIARNKCGFVYLFTSEPKYNTIDGEWESCDSEQVELGILCFPEVTFENSPQKVEIILRKESLVSIEKAAEWIKNSFKGTFGEGLAENIKQEFIEKIRN